MTRSLRSKIATSIAVVGFVVASVSVWHVVASRAAAPSAVVGPAAHGETPVIRLPERRSDQGQPPAGPPHDPPPACANAPSFTAVLATEIRDGTRRTKVVSRTARSIHVRLGPDQGAPEWLFVQNPVDPRRVSGSLVDHAKRVILEHDDSALRNGGIAAGWGEVVTAGIGPDVLATPATDKAERAFAGLGFREHRLGIDDPVREVWWNDGACLPLRIVAVVKEAIQVTELERLTPGVDADLLLDPRRRFPAYRVVDAIDWLEKAHDHAIAETTAHGRTHADRN